ncbi:MAG TPA: hypothetical protein VGM73_05870 [Candidatus Didemnitutus sp.]|jgi:hypothetical protein
MLPAKRLFLICAALTAAALVSAQETQVPHPAPAGEPSVHPPAHPPGMPMPGAPSPMQMQPQGLPPFLQGVITMEEYQTLQKFRRDTDASPEMKAINDKIKELRAQIIAQQREVGALRMKAMESNPEIKAISDKIQAATRAHSPMPTSMPQFRPMPGPGAAPAVTPPLAPVSSPTPPAKS